MKNTKLSALLATTAVLALAACGGSGTSNGDVLNPTTPPPVEDTTTPPVEDTTTPPVKDTTTPSVKDTTTPSVEDTTLSSTVIKTYADGSGVIIGTADFADAGGVGNFAFVATDVDVGKKVIDGDIELTVVDGAIQGRFYVVDRVGTSSSGSSLRVLTSGENLNLTGSEFASLSLVFIDNEVGILSGGTPIQSLPSGSFLYTGPASVAGVDGVGDGTFSFSGNFDTRRGVITALIPDTVNNPTYFFGAERVDIDPSSGKFFTSNATIGILGSPSSGGSSVSASISGSLAGSSAQGVHGIVYDNGVTPQYTGGFYGSR